MMMYVVILNCILFSLTRIIHHNYTVSPSVTCLSSFLAVEPWLLFWMYFRSSVIYMTGIPFFVPKNTPAPTPAPSRSPHPSSSWTSFSGRKGDFCAVLFPMNIHWFWEWIFFTIFLQFFLPSIRKTLRRERHFLCLMNFWLVSYIFNPCAPSVSK